MGSAVSVQSYEGSEDSKPLEVYLKKLPDAIEESIYMHEKFPVIIDSSEQAARFLKYQTGTFINFDDPIQRMPNAMNRALVGALQYGRTLTIKFATLEGLEDKLFTPGMFPIEVLSRSTFFKDDVWHGVIKPDLGDPEPSEMNISSEFVFIICTATDYIPPLLKSSMRVIKVVDKQSNVVNTEQDDNSSSIDPAMDQIASMFGAVDIVRNSIPLVEAGFDGDLEEIKLQIQKGYHIESVDGRKHTALSEAACQGHMEVIGYLLENGADPNLTNDVGRSALWRASFNGHADIVRTLLEAGANPDCKDKTSMESVYDVASTEDVRQILSEWDIARTVQLITTRKRIMLANLESRIKTSAEREQLAKNIIRKELVDMAMAGDIAGIRNSLESIAAEVNKSKQRPRATVEVRNDSGQSLLSIAAQYDNLDLATFLLTHYKDIDKDKWDLAEGEISEEGKIFRANPNSRDMKGWTCVCIAVFHDSRKVLQLLLEHGGDPGIRSSYNKNAWDLAKDEMDAAEHVIKSKAEIRQVLIDHDRSVKENTRKSIFGQSDSRALVANGEQDKSKLYEGLDHDGSAMVMNIEMNNEMLKENVTTNNKGNNNSNKKVTKSGGSNSGNTTNKSKSNTGKQKK